MVKILYARCSTVAQNEARQIAFADEMGIENCYRFIDKASGKNTDRPALQECLKTIEMLSNADVECDLYITELSRLGRNLKDLIAISEKLDSLGCALHSQKEQIETRTPTGRLLFHLLASIAEFQRDLINENASIGRAEAKKAGKAVGRPKVDEKALEIALHLFATDSKISVADISKQTGISRSKIYKEANAHSIPRALSINAK